MNTIIPNESSSLLQKKAGICTFCLGDQSEGLLISNTECGCIYSYHQGCFNNYLDKSFFGNKRQCPICKVKMKSYIDDESINTCSTTNVSRHGQQRLSIFRCCFGH